MTPVTRIDIVVSAHELDQVTEALEGLGIEGYTIIRNVSGKGSRGVRNDDELSDVFRNVCITVACEPARATQVVEMVRPFLKRYGGMCLLSDAKWVMH